MPATKLIPKANLFVRRNLRSFTVFWISVNTLELEGIFIKCGLNLILIEDYLRI